LDSGGDRVDLACYLCTKLGARSEKLIVLLKRFLQTLLGIESAEFVSSLTALDTGIVVRDVLVLDPR